MPFGLHGPDLIIVLAIALLIFGPKRLPEMGSAVGKTFQSFKRSMNEPEKPETPPAATPLPTASAAQLPPATETTSTAEVAQ